MKAANNIDTQRKIVCMPVHSFYENDSRVRRCARTLAEEGYDVQVVAYWPTTGSFKASKKILIDGVTLHQLLLNNKGGKVRFFEMMYRMRKYILNQFNQIDIIHCHDLDTLSPAVGIAKHFKSILIYDSHEWYTGSIHVGHRPLVKKIWSIIERYYIPKVDHVITVNESIAETFENTYHNRLKSKVSVVRNFDEVVPSELSIVDFPTELISFIQSKQIKVVYGGYIQKGRGLEALIHSMHSLDESIGLIIAGEGPLDSKLKAEVSNLGLDQRVYFTGQLDVEMLYELYRNADIGYCFIEPIAESYRMALPNKLSQYAQCGLAVVGSDLFEIKRLIERYNLGCIANNEEEIASSVITIVQNLAHYKLNVKNSAQKLSWNEEKAVLSELYRKFT